MKKTQIKDALRNIWKQKISFLSIVVIAALGVTLFLGIDYAAEAIRGNGTVYYQSANFRDIEAVSTLLFSEADVEMIRSLEGVKDAEGINAASARVSSELLRKDVTVISLTERINLPVLTEGRLPVNAQECAPETSLAEQMGWKIGDAISLCDADGGPAQYLAGKDYVICGLVQHPDHICGSVPDTPYVLVTRGAFDTETLGGCYMKVEITTESTWSAARFDAAYREKLAPVLQAAEALGEERAPLREQEAKELARQQIAENREKLNEAAAQLEEGRAQLDDAKNQLADAKAELEEGWDKLEDAKEQIRQLLRSKLESLFVRPDLLPIHWAGKEEINIDDPEASAKHFQITEKLDVELKGSLQEVIEEIVGSSQIPELLLKTVSQLGGDGGEYDPEEAKEQLAELLTSALGDRLGEFDELLSGCGSWDEGRQAYLDGVEKLRAGEEEYQAGLEALEEGERKILEAEETVETLGPCRWILLDPYGNSSFVQLASSRDNLKGLEMTFSLLFILVGAMVIYATISKMVDEQRPLVGTTKALGFFRSEVFAKYLIFGVSATLLGFLLGMLLARFWVESFILNGYQLYYRPDIRRPAFAVGKTLLVLAAGLLLAFGAVWFACARLLKTPAVKLMQAAVPEGRKKAAGRKKHVLSLYSRLILLNIRTDWKRVMVTIFSVAGCCALVVIGFTLRHAVDGSLKHQFEDIVRYDVMVKFSPDDKGNTAEEIGGILREAGAENCLIQNCYITVKIKDLEIQELYCGNLSAIARMHSLSDIRTGEPLVPSDDGIYIAKRFSEVYHLGAGDSLEITLNGTETVTVKVAGIFNNYMNRTMMMSDGCYRKLFGREYEPNAWLVKLGSADGEALKTKLRAVDGFENWRLSDEFRALFASATKVMNAVVLLFIFMAAIMAGVVLMNLTNIYIMQKKRELTIMRVNGFTVKEVIGYVTRETVLTTAAGILLGIAMGAWIGYRIVRALEQPFVQFDRSVSVTAWLIGAAMTLLFTVIINVIVLRKVKDLKLTDVT